MYISIKYFVLVIFITAVGVLAISTSANTYRLEEKVDGSMNSTQVSIERVEMKLDNLIKMHTEIVPYRRIK